MPTSTQRFRLVGEDDASRAFLQVAAAAKLLKSNMDDVSSSVAGLGKLMGGTSLIPIAAGATAAVANLTTALGAASGAGGVFGLSVVGQVKSMLQQQKTIKATDASLSKLTKGTTEYRDTLTKLHLQQKAFNQDFGPAAKGLDQMSASWGKFLDGTKSVTNGVLAQSFGLVASVLPKLVPVSNAAGKAIGGLISDLQNWTEGPSFKHLLHFLETSGPKDITAFGHSIGNVLSGLGGLLSNFVGPGDNAAKTLERLTESFDKWGHSKGVSDGTKAFLKYVSDNGPEIRSTFKSMADAAPKLATALGNLGSANLSVTSRFLNLIAGMPQGAFNVVVTGMFGIAAASKAITAVTGLKAITTGLAGMAGGKGLAGKAAGGGILGGAGVQKVWVVNMGEGGMGGPGGGGKGVFGRAAGFAEKHPIIAGGLASTAAVAGLATSIYLIYKLGKETQASAQSRNSVAGMDSSTTKKFNDDRMAQMYGANWNGQAIKAASNHLDSLNQKLSKASQGMELAGRSADRAFAGSASRAVESTSAKLQRLTKVHAEQAFDLIGHSASKNSAAAGQNVDVLTGKINHIPNRSVKVTADTGAAQAQVRAISAAIAGIQRVVNVHVNVSRSTNANVAEASTNFGGGAHGGSGGGASGGASRGYSAKPRVSWWDSTGAPLLSAIVGRGKMPMSQILSGVRGARGAGRSRLQATIGTRNQFAAGFQSFATSAFGADYGTDDAGVAIAPTITSILGQAQGQRSQAAMIKTDVRKLIAMGLSPALLKQLQAAGASGIPTIQALAGASRSQIAQYNRLNKATTSDLRSAGMAAGNRIYGAQIRKEEKHNQAVEHLLKQLVDMAKHHPDKLVAELRGDHIDLLLKNERRRKGKLQSDS